MTPRTFSPETQCVGKRPYRKKADAKRAAKQAEQYGMGRLDVYRCPHCQLFHLGHKPQRAYDWTVQP